MKNSDAPSQEQPPATKDKNPCQMLLEMLGVKQVVVIPEPIDFPSLYIDLARARDGISVVPVIRNEKTQAGSRRDILINLQKDFSPSLDRQEFFAMLRDPAPEQVKMLGNVLLVDISLDMTARARKNRLTNDPKTYLEALAGTLRAEGYGDKNAPQADSKRAGAAIKYLYDHRIKLLGGALVSPQQITAIYNREYGGRSGSPDSINVPDFREKLLNGGVFKNRNKNESVYCGIANILLKDFSTGDRLALPEHVAAVVPEKGFTSIAQLETLADVIKSKRNGKGHKAQSFAEAATKRQHPSVNGRQ